MVKIALQIVIETDDADSLPFKDIYETNQVEIVSRKVKWLPFSLQGSITWVSQKPPNVDCFSKFVPNPFECGL